MSKTSQSDTDDILKSMNAEIYDRFRHAIAIGKWPNGDLLTDQQRKTCMEAIIIYEHVHIPEEQRTGYMPTKKSDCEMPENKQTEQPQKIVWQQDN